MNSESVDLIYLDPPFNGRQEGVCNGCLVHFPFRNLTVDHIVPQSKGGTDHESNLQLLCGTCNSRKGAVRWSRFFGQVVKVDSMIEQRHRDGQKETEIHRGVQFKGRVALEALRERDSVQAIAARHELHPNQVSAWKRQLLDAVPEAFAKGGARRLAAEHEAKIHDLHAKIGELTVERDFFRRGLKR